MEDDLKDFKLEDDLIFLKMEDHLNFFLQIENDLNIILDWVTSIVSNGWRPLQNNATTNN